MTFNQKSFALSKPNIHSNWQSHVPEHPLWWRFPSSTLTLKWWGRLCWTNIGGIPAAVLLWEKTLSCCQLQNPDPTRIWNLNWQAKRFHCLNFQRSWYNQKKVLKVFCFQKCRTLWEITHPGYSALLNQVIDQFPIGHCVSIGGENVSWGICQSMKQETQDGFTPAVVKELWEWTESSLQAWPVVLKDGGDAWTNSKIAVMCWAGCSERLLWALRD